MEATNASPEKVMLEAKALRALESMEGGASESEVAKALGAQDAEVLQALSTLKQAGAAESRKVGGTTAWFALQLTGLKRVLIVEDEQNINDLMKLTIGKGFEVKQAFSLSEAMAALAAFKPNLVILDLMLPDGNGLDFCQKIKSNPATRETAVIIVSAADAVKNRLAGIKLGADYYVKKPFNAGELRSLTNIFLKKKGKRFDPLVDLPDEKRLSAALEKGLSKSDSFEVQNLRIENLPEFERSFGREDSQAVVRLVSQILQDKVQEWDSKNGFVGYIGRGEFIVGGGRNETQLIVGDVAGEFEKVLPFIYQGKAGKLELGIEELFDAAHAVQKPLKLSFDIVPMENILQKRSEILGGKSASGGAIEVGAYTYKELQSLVGSDNVDVSITRDGKGVKLSISRKAS